VIRSVTREAGWTRRGPSGAVASRVMLGESRVMKKAGPDDGPRGPRKEPRRFVRSYCGGGPK
jgi:hypothetical protein